MKKKFAFCCLLLVSHHFGFAQNVGIGTPTPNASAALDVQSTSKGLLPPRMTTLQRDAIASPSAGLIIFNTDTQSLEVFTNTGWFGIKKTNFAIEKLLGGTANERYPYIQKTTDGGYIVAGSSNSSATGNVSGTGHGGLDFWIIKLNAFGNIAWNKLLGGSADDTPNSIQQTTDGGYIVAGFSASSASGDVTATSHGSNDYWIVKLDPLGNISWNKLLGGDQYEDAFGIQQTTDGGYIVEGFSFSSANGNVTQTNHGGLDFWIVKLDALGNITWSKLLGGTGDETMDYHSIQQTSDGGYIIAGTSTSSANGDVTGTSHGTGLQAADYWIVKLDALGNITWNKLLGGNSIEYATAIQQTTDGGFIVAGQSSSSANGNVTGTSHGGYDYWIVKLDATGNITWNKLLGGNAYEVATAVQKTPDGGYIIVGTSESSQNGNVTPVNHGPGAVDYWIVKLDALGNIVWNKLLGGYDWDYATSIQLTSTGGYIIAGYSDSSVNGDVTELTHGNYDFWIVKLDAFGNIIYQ